MVRNEERSAELRLRIFEREKEGYLLFSFKRKRIYKLLKIGVIKKRKKVSAVYPCREQEGNVKPHRVMIIVLFTK